MERKRRKQMQIRPEIAGVEALAKLDEKERIPLNEADSSYVRALASCLSEDFLDDYRLTPSQIKRLENQLKKTHNRGLQFSGSMICQGPSCVMASACPLEKAGAPPIGLHCPIEQMEMERMRESLVDKMQIEEEDPVEMTRLNDLLVTIMIERRASAMLSADDVIEDTPAFATNSGEVVNAKKVHPALEVMDRCERRKATILREFVATREAKKKYGETLSEDKTVREAELLKMVEEVKNEVQDAEFERE
jgi:hypothetical protein